MLGLFLEITAKYNRRRSHFYFFQIFTLIFVVCWIGFTSYKELKETTLHLQAYLGLLDYSFAYLRNDDLGQIRERLREKNIYIWPEQGILLNPDRGDAKTKIEKIFETNYEEEYSILPVYEKKLLETFTLPTIDEEIYNLIKNNYILSSELYQFSKNLENNQKLAYFSKFFSSNRYVWNGYDKLIYFCVIKDGANYKVFFTSISDIADKSKFFKSILPSIFILVSIVFFFIFIFISNIRKLEKIEKLKNLINSTSSIPELTKILLTELKKQKMILSSVDILVLHGDSISIFSAQDNNDDIFFDILNESNPNYPKEIIQKLEDSKADYYLENKVRPDSIHIPIREQNQVYFLLSIHLLTKKINTSKIHFIIQFMNSITITLLKMKMEKNRLNELELKDYKSWIINQTSESPFDLFQNIKTRLFLSSNLRKGDFYLSDIIGIKLDENGIFQPFTGEILNLTQEQINKAFYYLKRFQENENKIFRDENQFIFIKPIFFKNIKTYIFFFFSERLEYLDYYFIELLESILGEFKKQIIYFIERSSREIVYSKLLQLGTGLQPEASEILKEFSESFFYYEGNHPFLTKLEIQERVHIWRNENLHFDADGYGILAEIDLFKSTEIKKILRENQEDLYSKVIQQVNSECYHRFNSLFQKFVVQSSAGGDGDGIRFFVSSLNHRQYGDEKFMPGFPILEKERKIYNNLWTQELIHMLYFISRLKVPFKLGGFLLESDLPMRLSIEKGEIKIHSFLQGFLHYSRSIKNWRLKNHNEYWKSSERDFSQSDYKLFISNKEIFQPWELVLPESLLKSSLEILNEEIFQIEPFFIPLNSNLNPNPRYYSIKIKSQVSHLLKVFPELIVLPTSWTLNLALVLTNELVKISDKYKDESSEAMFDILLNKQFSTKKGKSIDVNKEDLLSFYEIIQSGINIPGLYFPLEKKDVRDTTKEEFLNHIHWVKDHLLPRLFRKFEYGNQIYNLKLESYIVEDHEKQKYINEMNLKYREYYSLFENEKTNLFR
ncbi:MAG: hypothetical protein SFU98_08195 [Leptospiraceae bacterium]|nr:hypothetical protein [Leptospiraceae bacterium]